MLAKHRKDFAAKPEEAKKLLAVGDAPAPKDVAPGRTRGVDERVPRDPEPARDDHAAVMTIRITTTAFTPQHSTGHPCRRHPPLQRRTFLGQACRGVGGLALASLLAATAPRGQWNGVVTKPHVPPKAKRVIFMVMAGGPSHLELFDHKPELAKRHGQPMPESITKGQPIAQLQGAKLNCFGPQWGFKKHGKSGHRDERAVHPPAGSRRRPVHRPVAARPRRSTTTRPTRS